MFDKITSYCDSLVAEFSQIVPERKKLLEKLANHIRINRDNNAPINLVYICTHNSRRSHFGQVWSKVASEYFSIPNIHTYSGGTEATAFNLNAINALKRVGFKITPENQAKNPTYLVMYDDAKPPIECFSKVYDHPKNPQRHFAAIMTCSDAEENCPYIPGVELRLGTTYDDPKAFDGTPQQDQKYDERCRQIALETMYAFSIAKT